MGIYGIKLIQSFSNSVLDIFFTAITMLGEEMLIAIICAIIYWVYDKNLGKMLVFTIFLSSLINGIIKDTVKAARPNINDNIRILRPQTATGFSFPSGHTQNAVTAYSYLAFYFKKRWLSITIFLVCILIAVSRIYLGAHFPRDVIGGFVFGLAISVLSFYILNKFKNKNYLFFSVAILLTFFLFFHPSVDFIKSLGCIYGLAAGSLFEEKWVKFSTDIKLTRKFVRLILGLFLLLALQVCLKLAFPQFLIYDFIRYFIIVFTAIGLYPLSFISRRMR